MPCSETFSANDRHVAINMLKEPQKYQNDIAASDTDATSFTCNFHHSMKPEAKYNSIKCERFLCFCDTQYSFRSFF